MQKTRPFAIRYSIENIFSVTCCFTVCGDGMRCVLLIIRQSIEILRHKVIPSQIDVFEAFGIVHAHPRNHIGKRFIEPEVRPPFHRHEVAEPHVRNLMENSVINILLPSSRELVFALNILISIQDASNVFHGSHIVVRCKHLVKFVKWILAVEHLFVVLDTVACHSEPIFRNVIHIFGK